MTNQSRRGAVGGKGTPCARILPGARAGVSGAGRRMLDSSPSDFWNRRCLTLALRKDGPKHQQNPSLLFAQICGARNACPLLKFMALGEVRQFRCLQMREVVSDMWTIQQIPKNEALFPLASYFAGSTAMIL